MRLRTTALAAVALAGLVVAPAVAAEVTGRVIRIERIHPDQHLVVLSDGRAYRVPSSAVVLVENRAVAPGTLSPGQTVVIRSDDVVEIPPGSSVTVSPGQVDSPAASPPVVVTPTPPAAARHTLYGRVEDVDDDGTVKIDTGRDSFKVRLRRDAVRGIREGDTVQIDMTVVPAGTPAASPR